jgi:hypothetical protein
MFVLFLIKVMMLAPISEKIFGDESPYGGSEGIAFFDEKGFHLSDDCDRDSIYSVVACEPKVFKHYKRKMVKIPFSDKYAERWGFIKYSSEMNDVIRSKPQRKHTTF